VTEIQQNRYDQLLRRVNNIVSPGSMVADALNELFPMIDVESLVMDLSFLSGTKHGIASQAFAPSAGELNHYQLFNPADSGNIITLTRVDLHTTASQQFEYDVSAAAIGTSTATHRLRDTRDAVTDQPVGQVRGVQQAGGLPTVGALFVIANTQSTIENQKGLFVLAPGTGVTFATTTNNTTATLTFQWRERVAQAAELNF